MSGRITPPYARNDDRPSSSNGKKDHLPAIMDEVLYKQSNPDNLSDEELDIGFKAYRKNCLQIYSDEFVNTNIRMEWFQNRYNPVHIYNTEKALIDRASEESAVIQTALHTQSTATVKAMRLGISGETETNTSTERIPTILPSVSRNLTGLDYCALYISNIPASCSTLELRSAVSACLSANSSDTSLDSSSLYMAQPVWDAKNRLVRYAWLVMPTVESSKQALIAMRDNLYVGTADQRSLVHVERHAPQLRTCSHHTDLQQDINRALLFAKRLDKIRNVPSAQTLATILMHPPLVAAQELPTDVLDVAIAYLRRVHLLDYYRARMYNEVSELLYFASSAPLRAEPYSGSAVQTSTTGSKREYSSAEAGGEHRTAGTTKKLSASAADDNWTSRIDKIDGILLDMCLDKEKRDRNPLLPASYKEEQANIFTTAQNDTYHRCVQERCEGNRCCYSSCNQPFGNHGDLVCHLRRMHADFASEELQADADLLVRNCFETEPIQKRPLLIKTIGAQGECDEHWKPVKEYYEDEHARTRLKTEYVGPCSALNHNRVICNYQNVLVPDEIPMVGEYGVALPSSRKRRKK